MKQKSILQIMIIALAVSFIPIFVNTTAHASMAAATIGFNLNESISEANYLQWKIESSEAYGITVWLKDGDGEIMNISFSPSDQVDEEEYEIDEEVDYLMVEFPSSLTYETESFEDLIDIFLSEDDDSSFDPTDNPKITRIQINGGSEYKFYSITLADNQDFDDPCWSKKATDWNNLTAFIQDGGNASAADIRFNNSYIQVTNAALSALHSQSIYSWGLGNIGWMPNYVGLNQPYNYLWGQGQPSNYGQPYNYGWNQPSGYSWNQPYNYAAWNQPSNYGWGQPSNYGQPYNYGWNQPSGYSWNQPYNYAAWNQPSNYGWGQPSYGWNQPSNYAWNQPSNYGWGQPSNYGQPYNYGWNQPSYGWNQSYSGYQVPYNPFDGTYGSYDDDHDQPIDFSRVIWTDEFSGFDPFTGVRFII